VQFTYNLIDAYRNMANNDWKERLGMVYSTNPNFKYEQENGDEQQTLPAAQQKLIVAIDKKGRAGKQVTIVTGFIGKDDDLQTLGKTIKTKCGVGGSVKEGVILVQGDMRDKIVTILTNLGYKAKRGN
jgi:translation initiation factor 1